MKSEGSLPHGYWRAGGRGGKVLASPFEGSTMPALLRLTLTGASGFLARCVRRALKRQDRIVALDGHSRLESQVPPDGEVEWHQVELGEPEQVRAVLRRIAAQGGAEVLIHLAAHYDFTGEDDPESWRTNVDGLRSVPEGSRGLRLRRFIFASSLVACAFPPRGPAVSEEAAEIGDELWQAISQTIRFGIDQVEAVYEAVQGRAFPVRTRGASDAEAPPSEPVGAHPAGY